MSFTRDVIVLLTVYIKGVGQTNKDVVPANLDIVTDVEASFVVTNFQATGSNCRLVQDIDQGTLVSRLHFKDRFGTMLYTDMLSTGCKAALIVNNTSKVVDLLGCGWNARDAILQHCKEGAVVMEDPEVTICTVNKEPVEISIDGHIFHDLDDVNWYLTDGRMEEAVLRNA